MCDVQLQRHAHGFLWAKNSDREASEPQLIRRYAAVRGDTTRLLQATYLSLPQVSDRHAVILSQPGWIWGAEMGANDCGVVIGNTAVFSRLATAEPGLIGMDLLRLALERASTARRALEQIVELLQAYGQGGPCGYRNKGFLYDNAFLIADAAEAWQLETAGRHWVAVRVRDHAAISNCMSIGAEYDLASEGIADFARRRGFLSAHADFDFARAFETVVMPVASGARMRRRLSMQCLSGTAGPVSLAGMMQHLRTHGRGRLRHNHDVCMHAAGRLTRPSQATSAMVADCSTQGLRLLLTGTSATCRSVFRPVAFGTDPWSVLTGEGQDGPQDLWHRHESVQRRMALGLIPPDIFAAERDEQEARLLAALDQPVSEQLAVDAALDRWHTGWVARARAVPWRYQLMRPAHRFWRQMNQLDSIA